MRVEVNGIVSSERIYRAGLPQGSVLSTALYLLWSAPLAATLQEVPGTNALMYADGTAALCVGNRVEMANRRTQQAADALAKWALEAMMRVASPKVVRWCSPSGPAMPSTAPSR